MLVLRRVFVHSGARAAAAASARAKKLDRARDDLDRLGRGLGGRHYPDPDAVTARVAAIARDRRVGGYLRADVGTDPATGKPTLAWSFDQAALDAEAATDGWYALLTNLPATVDAAGCCVATRARRPWNVATARSRGRWPGPMFLHDNRRITALITVICLALLIFCLVERQVRHAIVPDTHLEGLGSATAGPGPPGG